MGVRDLVRRSGACKPITDTYGGKALPSDDSQLLIVGHDISSFTKLDEATLRARRFLLLTKSKQRISPSAVQIKGILFRFPKKLLVTPSTLSIDDNELKFVSQAGTTQIKASLSAKDG